MANALPPVFRHPFVLELKPDAGRIVGRVIEQGPDGSKHSRPLDYFPVTPAGMTYGYINGMRPRAVLLFALKRDDDELVGEMIWGGITLRVDGELPPTIHVRLRRTR